MTFRIGTAHTRGAGYFLNDKATSRPQEDDIQTCNHCQRLIKLREERDGVAVCMGCMKLTCPPCSLRALQFGCEPFIAKLDRYMDATVKLAQFRKMAGLDP